MKANCIVLAALIAAPFAAGCASDPNDVSSDDANFTGSGETSRPAPEKDEAKVQYCGVVQHPTSTHIWMPSRNGDSFFLPTKNAVTTVLCNVVLAEHGTLAKPESFEALQRMPVDALVARKVFTSAEATALKVAITEHAELREQNPEVKAKDRWQMHEHLGEAASRVSALVDFLDTWQGVTDGPDNTRTTCTGNWRLTAFADEFSATPASPAQYGFTCDETEDATVLDCKSYARPKDVPQSTTRGCPARL